MLKVRNEVFEKPHDRVAVRMAVHPSPTSHPTAAGTRSQRLPSCPPADRPTTHSLEAPVLPCRHAVAAAASLPTRRRPAAFLPPGQQTSPESLEQPSGCLSSVSSTQKVVGPRGGPERKGRPWQRPAGRPTRGDPDLRPPAVVASGLAVCPWPLRPCPTPASPPVGNPVLHPPAVQIGVTLSAAAAGCRTTAGVLPVFSLLTRSL